VDKKIQIIAIIAVVTFSVFVLTSPSDPVPLPLPLSTSNSESTSVSILAENLDKPRAIAISGDRIFVTEKDGFIRVIQNNTLIESPLAVFRSANVFDGGLLGIALHPDFSNNHYIYVFLTYTEDGYLWNKILRITESENKLQDAETIFDKIPGSTFTNGGFIKFGPDGKLYVGTGTISDSSHLPQDLDSLSGKILRINDDGTIPNDNPFTDSPVYSLGHRNPQGMTWDDNGNMFVAEFGPEKNDEINLIQAGKNYGWMISYVEKNSLQIVNGRRYYRDRRRYEIGYCNTDNKLLEEFSKDVFDVYKIKVRKRKSTDLVFKSKRVYSRIKELGGGNTRGWRIVDDVLQSKKE